jgi:hypothetical protein
MKNAVQTTMDSAGRLVLPKPHPASSRPIVEDRL